MVEKKNQAFHKKSFRYTTLVMNILEKIISPKFNIDGLENLPKKPILFVANHFTRFETFIIPYIIYKNTGRQVRCLADSSLFKGGFGNFLTKVGAISTKDPNRNNIVVGDLISGSYDWIIYPEGMMVKNKSILSRAGNILSQSGFISNTPYGINRTKTGASILALQSEIYRQEIIDAYKNNDQEIIDFHKNRYDIEYSEDLKDVDTHIVPLNITYYPIRPGKNIIQAVTQKFLKKLPKSIVEELEIEGNLLLSANINLGFSKAISVADYSKKSRNLVNSIPLIGNKAKSDMVIQYLKHSLTSEFMKDIYFNTKINLDHLFTYVIFSYPKDTIGIQILKNIIYSSAIEIAKTKKYRLSYSIIEENLFKIFIAEPHKEFDSIVKLAKSTKVIQESEDGKSFIINKETINQQNDFDNIRKDNTLRVIFNEFSLLETANRAVKRSMQMDHEKLKQEVFREILNSDIDNFNFDYDKYYNSELSKEKSIGSPFFLDSNHKNNDVGIVVCHGYQSAPKEVEKMAEYFNKLGFRIYGVRLKGHGTAPQNMEDIGYQDWYDSLQRGYGALSILCSKIILIGFSTGGLLSLLSCARKPQNSIYGVVTINAALKLQDIRSRLVPGITIWNDLLSKFKIKKATLRYIVNNSENPTVNYSQNYLSGVNELEKLMHECTNDLIQVLSPALIIYSKNDPIVKPSSSVIIEQDIKSKIKELVELDSDKHIIINGKGSVEIFKKIEEFISKLLLT